MVFWVVGWFGLGWFGMVWVEALRVFGMVWVESFGGDLG